MDARIKDDIALTARGQTGVLFKQGEIVPVEPKNENSNLLMVTEESLRANFPLTRSEVEVLYTVEEFAAIVGRHPETVRRWLDDESGPIEGFKVEGPGKGGQWRIPESELDTLEYPKRGGNHAE